MSGDEKGDSAAEASKAFLEERATRRLDYLNQRECPICKGNKWFRYNDAVVLAKYTNKMTPDGDVVVESGDKSLLHRFECMGCGFTALLRVGGGGT